MKWAIAQPSSKLLKTEYFIPFCIKMGVIYCLTSPSGKKYIGQTTREIDKRFEEHCTRKECRILYNAIQKHGKDNFKKEILLECNNDFLNEHEINYTLYPAYI
ncbi:MAG: GIY-YIG nuclease family protein [Nanoarchaeota archaeon]